jgi:hypothetical protein
MAGEREKTRHGNAARDTDMLADVPALPQAPRSGTPAIAAVFATIAHVFLSVTDIFATITHVFAAITHAFETVAAPTIVRGIASILSAVTHVFAAITHVFATISDILASVAHVFHAIAHAWRLRLGGERVRGQRQPDHETGEQGASRERNECGMAFHERLLVVHTTDRR